MPSKGWIGVDLDGTLAEYHGWEGVDRIGPPVPAMLERVERWLEEGIEVRIVTARVSHDGSGRSIVEANLAAAAIYAWCRRYLGCYIPVTCVKDYAMRELWDDRAVTVEQNTGKVICHPAGQPTP